MKRERKGLVSAAFVIVWAAGILATGGVAADIQPDNLKVVAPAKIAEARTLQAKAKAAQLAGDHRTAVELFAAAVQANPLSTSALTDLAYLQATSDDPAVRNPDKASANANLAMLQMQGKLHQQMSGALQAQHPGTDLKSGFLNMKACIFNAYAAARAAGNDFDRAAAFVDNSVRAAQALSNNSPNTYNGMMAALMSNKATIYNSQSLHGTPPITCSFIE